MWSHKYKNQAFKDKGYTYKNKDNTRTRQELSFSLSLSLSLSVLTAILQVNLGQLVFIEAKDDGGGGDN